MWLSLDPQSGHEQRGRRPALIVSNNTFSAFTQGMAMVCPISNTNKAIPIHVALSECCLTTGVILCDQVKALDMNARNAEYIETVPSGILAEVVDIITGFVEIEA